MSEILLLRKIAEAADDYHNKLVTKARGIIVKNAISDWREYQAKQAAKKVHTVADAIEKYINEKDTEEHKFIQKLLGMMLESGHPFVFTDEGYGTKQERGKV